MGIGDDAAILQAADIQQLVVSTDTLVSGTHFKAKDSAQSLGHKSLAVSFSDMAAMGAKPKWVLLNLTLPAIDNKWVTGFIQGFAKLLTQHSAQLIGGDTTQGPLSITVTVIGETKLAVRRDGAKVDDLIVITGELGSAAFALKNPRKSKLCNAQLHRPNPRLDVSEQVKNMATAMIDVSDGLMADLGHICAASQLAAVIELTQVPVHDIVKKHPDWMSFVLAGGDDYQLCFTINMEDEDKLPEDCHIIGQMIEGQGVVVLNQHQPIETNLKGYQHFSQ